jgi:hypothetical protein
VGERVAESLEFLWAAPITGSAAPLVPIPNWKGRRKSG